MEGSIRMAKRWKVRLPDCCYVCEYHSCHCCMYDDADVDVVDEDECCEHFEREED